MARFDIFDGTSQPAGPASRRPSEVLRLLRDWCAARPLLLCVLVLAVAPFWQLRWGTVGDTAWLIHVCEQMLAGARLYVVRPEK